jgi:UDP-GlcNAc:undecaprenyl-phosphate GlcNAc-1-phosphate transferase
VDTCLVLISRRRAGRSLLVGGTDHISHRLRRLGMSVRQVTFTLFAATLLPCLCGVLVAEQRLPGSAVVVGAMAVAVALIWLLLRIPIYPAEKERTDFLARPLPARALSTDRLNDSRSWKTSS